MIICWVESIAHITADTHRLFDVAIVILIVLIIIFIIVCIVVLIFKFTSIPIQLFLIWQNTRFFIHPNSYNKD